MAFFLVVEDNPANVALISEVLEDEGHDFVVARDGAAGLAHAYNLMPDVILMDVSLPLLSGLDATTILKNEAKTRDIPVLALTAHAMAGDRDECIRAGCDDYETKPINTARVLQKAESLMRGRDPAFVMQLQRLRSQGEGAEGSARAAALTEQLEAAEGALTERAEALKRAQAEVLELQGALAKKDEELQGVQEAQRAAVAQAESRSNGAVLRRMQSLEQQLGDATGRARSLEAALGRTSGEHERAREAMTRLFEERMGAVRQEHLAELERVRRESGGEALAELEEARSTHAAEVSALRASAEREKAELSEIHAEDVAALTRQASAERARLQAEHEAALEALRSDKRKEKRRASASRRSALAKKLDEANATIAQLREQEQALRARTQELQNQPMDVQLLRAELQRAKADAASSRRALAGLQSAVRQAVDASFTEILNGSSDFYAV